MTTPLICGALFFLGFSVLQVQEGFSSPPENRSPPPRIEVPTETPSPAQQRIASPLRTVIRLVAQLGTLAASAKAPPAVRLTPDGNVEVYIYTYSLTLGDEQTLQKYGVHPLRIDQSTGIVYASLAVDTLEAIATLPFVRWIGPPAYGTLNTGSVTSEGDTAMRAALARSQLGVDGRGVRVGVISDSLEDLQASVATGDLPANLTIVNGQAGNGADEGRAMAEIVYDLAPGADLLFHTGFPTSLDMIAAVQALTEAGANVIVDDVEFFDEPVFELGPVAQTVQQAIEQGVVYVTAAGNNAEKHYKGVYTEFNPLDGNPTVNLHDFGDGDPTLVVDIFPFQSLSVFLQWPNPFDGSANTADYDLFLRDVTGQVDACTLTDDDGESLLNGACSSTDRQLSSNAPPLERIDVENNSFETITVAVVINRFGGEALPLSLYFSGAVELRNHIVATNSIFGHPCVQEALTVGAIDVSDYTASGIENFSSHGPCELFFPTHETYMKPDVVAADGVSTSLINFDPFFGTSAAAPHAAAVAALLIQATGGPEILTNEAIVELMRTTAVKLNESGADTISGFGVVDAFRTVYDGTILSGGGFATFWVGLKKSDNEGALFDLQVELFRDGALVAVGETLCLSGVTKDPEQAKEVVVRLLPTSAGRDAPPAFGAFALRVFTRLGTNGAGELCQGPQGSRNSASGLRLYYDAKDRPSRFNIGITPEPFLDYFLHSFSANARSDFLDTLAPEAETVRHRSSDRLNFKKRNFWQPISAWYLSLPTE